MESEEGGRQEMKEEDGDEKEEISREEMDRGDDKVIEGRESGGRG